MPVTIVLDACSIINLFHAGALRVVLEAGRAAFVVTPLVLLECGPRCAAELLALQQEGLVRFIGDEDVPVGRVLELVSAHDIGNGENESIAVCEAQEWGFCSDDRRARSAAEATLGPDRVIGGLRLLRWAVEDGAIECADAMACFTEMKRRGGFLPQLERDFFCALDQDC